MLSKKSSHWWGVDVWKKYMNGWMAIEGGTGGGGGASESFCTLWYMAVICSEKLQKTQQHMQQS